MQGLSPNLKRGHRMQSLLSPFMACSVVQYPERRGEALSDRATAGAGQSKTIANAL
jgi:hypothetical protein